MKKRFLIYTFIGLSAITCLTGCGEKKPTPEVKKEEPVKANCEIKECIKQIEPTNTYEEINTIMGFEGTKSEFSGDITWKINSKNFITLKEGTGSHILQATIDKETIKNEDVKFPSSKELQDKLNNGSFTYEELVEILGGVDGTLSSKTGTSVGYTWVNKNNQTLGATFNNKSKKCTVASFR